VLTLDADRNAACSPSINEMPVSHAICTLQPDVHRLHALVRVGFDMDWKSTLPDSVEQAMGSACFAT
jgi:hypothetical protein